MTESYDAVTKLVIDRLNTISKANGYLNNLTVLNGWLTFYAKDLANGKNGKTFPAVSVHYGSDTYKCNTGAIDATVDRTIKITGAVTTDTPEEVNEKLDDLLKDVKVALGTNRKLTIVSADFMLPEGNDPYAMFDMTLVVNINEKWEL
ncbi:tail-completion protein [Vibrio phage 1.055.O._10N.286.55.E9]|nr:tail-completion protein [Vibrio phage 1.055.O._10N.286.55.E9]